MDPVNKDSLTPEKGTTEKDEPVSSAAVPGPDTGETGTKPDDAPVDFPEPDVK